MDIHFTPPSVPKPITSHTTTYHSDIPKNIDSATPLILGVDEAGRGPVLGPMVYGVAYTSLKFNETKLKEYEFADSKKLTESKRTELMKLFCQDGELSDNVGWCVTNMTAKDISSDMLKPKGLTYNLNDQAHDTTMNLIESLLKKNLSIKEVYIDTVGPPTSYTKKLKEKFPMIDKIVVAKKADSIYPIVSTASVVAKVTRDYYLFESSKNGSEIWGSGYPSDPKTSKWLNGNIDLFFGCNNNNVRFSWQTTKDAIKRHNGIEFVWEDELVEKVSYDINSLMSIAEVNANNNAGIINCNWFVK